MKKLSFVLFVLAIFLLVGCGSGESPVSEEPVVESPEVSQEVVSEPPPATVYHENSRIDVPLSRPSESGSSLVSQFEYLVGLLEEGSLGADIIQSVLGVEGVQEAILGSLELWSFSLGTSGGVRMTLDSGDIVSLQMDPPEDFVLTGAVIDWDLFDLLDDGDPSGMLMLSEFVTVAGGVEGVLVGAAPRDWEYNYLWMAENGMMFVTVGRDFTVFGGLPE